MALRYASQVIRLYRGDAQPSTLFQIFDETTGDPVDLTTYASGSNYVLFSLIQVSPVPVGAAVVKTVQLAVTDAVNGWCQLTWPDNLMSLVTGDFVGQLQLTRSSGTIVDRTIDRVVRITLLNPNGG